MYVDKITESDFITSETNKWGWEHIEALLNKGYEPTLVNGVWTWKAPVIAVSYSFAS